MRICVYCASGQHIEEKYLRLAAEVGTELARRGHTLVSGGGSISCMGAVARAARAGGARTVGVIPQALMDLEVGDREADELIVTPDMRSRKAEMDRRSDAFLVLPGGIGTLEELFEIWTARVLGMHGRPIALLDPYGLFDPLRELMNRLYEERFVRPGTFDAVTWTGSLTEAFDRLERGARRPLIPTPEEILESEP
ncbi:MAG: TIGR00730 family Rossman fold protein [Streptosporangiales bacterium]|nr:TIGR00730 family Rossman fold protein [Streptosporangiales bacterium]